MKLRKTLLFVSLFAAVLFLAGCGASPRVKKEAAGKIRKVAVVSLYCPAMITVDNPRQAVGFHLVDIARQGKLKRAEMMEAFRPRGLFLLGIANEELTARLSSALGWQVMPVSAAVKTAAYGPLRALALSRDEKIFQLMMSVEGGAPLWLSEKDDELRNALVKYCAAAGVDAVVIAAFDFAYTKGPWTAEGSFPAARANTFTSMQVVDRGGVTVIDMLRADKRNRNFSEFSDETMKLKGWGADINERTIAYWRSSTRKSVEKVVKRMKKSM